MDDKVYDDCCIYIQKKLDQHEMTGADLAREIGVSSSIVYRWLVPSARVSEAHILKVADYFEVHPAWLRYGVDLEG